MEKDLEQIYVNFNYRARELFFSLFHEFESSVKKLDRKKEEQRFREMCRLYVHHCRHRLEAIARDLLHEHRSYQHFSRLSQNLSHIISDYTRQFVQKIDSL